MRLAYVTTYDASRKSGFNGCGFYAAQALAAQGVSIDYLGPLEGRFWKVYLAKQYYYRRLRKKEYTFERDRLMVKQYSTEVARKLSRLDVDIVFSGISPGSQPIAYLECKQPIVIWTDATVASVVHWYPHPGFANLCAESVRDAIANERSALGRCRLIIYSSDWAARTAISIYQIPPSRVKVVPFGPILDCDRTLTDVRRLVESRSARKCNLLFFASNWEFKGGEIALKVVTELNRNGLETQLTVAGCRIPPGRQVPPYVRVLGYLNKNSTEGLSQLNRVMTEAHFLILPTRADACPHAFAEANSFGVPCVATDIGGVATAVRNGLNGTTLPFSAPVSEYCAYIADLMSNYSRYKQLALSSFNEYQTRLNWSAAGASVKKLLDEIAA
jgi:glycosyltransferase involved in cell wall biosynthesis